MELCIDRSVCENIHIQFFLWLRVLRILFTSLIWFEQLFIFNMNLILRALSVRSDFQIDIIWCFIHEWISGRFNTNDLVLNSTLFMIFLVLNLTSRFGSKLFRHLLIFIVFWNRRSGCLKLYFWRQTWQSLLTLIHFGQVISFNLPQLMAIIWLNKTTLAVLNDLGLKWLTNQICIHWETLLVDRSLIWLPVVTYLIKMVFWGTVEIMHQTLPEI